MPHNLPHFIAFIREADRLKSVIRKTKLIDGSRRENTAEHSWHLMLMAMLLERYADSTVDLFRVLKMLMIHDLAEIEVGDVFVYDQKGRDAIKPLERDAAQKLFATLPGDLGAELFTLWCEFDDGLTADARYARALDRLQPVLSNLANKGGSWREFNVSYEDAVNRNRAEILPASKELWEWLSKELDAARTKGFFQTDH